MKKQESQPYLTIDEYAISMSVSSRTVRRMVRDGRLDAIKFGRVYRIKPGTLPRIETERKIGFDFRQAIAAL